MDLIADVLQHAEVKKLKLATAKLTGSDNIQIAKGTSVDFPKIESVRTVKHVQAETRSEFKKDQSRLDGNDAIVAHSFAPSRESQKAEAMRGLETILATKMVEAMMPKDQGELYGEGTAGEIWRGFHIDTMGKALASQQILSTSAPDVMTGEARERTKMIVPFAG